MASSADRNPPPPPEILEKEKNLVPDRIGGTLYSKRWVIKTLMDMLQVVKDYIPAEHNPDEMTPTGEEISELDPVVEENACALWDMCANEEVAQFLCEFDVADTFLTIINETKSPRLLEIVIGILGNMSSFNSSCEYISKQSSLMLYIAMLSGCSDSCTLVQLFRLLTCAILKEHCREQWFDIFDFTPLFMDNLQCILENNLCRDVLKGALEFLDNIITVVPTYCSVWENERHILSIIQCGKQIVEFNHYEDLDIYFSVVNTLCQKSSIVQIYAKNFDALRPIFHFYFTKLGEEDYLPQVARITAVTCVFALYGNLLMNRSIPLSHIIFDGNVFNAMLRMCNMVKQLVINTKNYERQDSLENPPTISVSTVTMTEETNGDGSSEEDTLQNWDILLDAIIHAAKSCATFQKASEFPILEEIVNFQKTAE